MNPSAAARKARFLEENLWRLMLRLSVPGLLGMGLVATNSLVDAILVGRLVGADALAGVSLVFPLTILIAAVTGLLSGGSASVLSRAIGAGRTDVQRKVLGNLFTLSLVFSLALALPGYAWAEQLVGLMGGPARISAYGSEYWRVFLLGAFFQVFGLSSNVLIRAEGNVGQAMRLAAGAVLADVLFSYVLIGYFDLGVRGGAWGTVLSMLLYCLLNLRYLLSGRSALPAGGLRPGADKELTREVLSVGVSALVMQGANFVRQVILFKTIAHYATGEELAFFGAVYRLYTFAVLPVFGLVQSLQPAVGINYGAGQYGRSVQAVHVYRAGGAGLLLLVSAVPLLFPAPVLALLLPEAAFSARDLFHFRLVMLLLPCVPVGVTGIVFFQATGRAKTASMLSLGRELLFVPLMLLMPYLWGVPGVYYGLFIENLLYFLAVWLATRFAFGTSETKIPGKPVASGA